MSKADEYAKAWAEWFKEHDKIPVGTPEWHESIKKRPEFPLLPIKPDENDSGTPNEMS